jgi:hypothetical protein
MGFIPLLHFHGCPFGMSLFPLPHAVKSSLDLSMPLSFLWAALLRCRLFLQPGSHSLFFEALTNGEKKINDAFSVFFSLFILLNLFRSFRYSLLLLLRLKYPRTKLGGSFMKKFGLPFICGLVCVVLLILGIILPAAPALVVSGSVFGRSYKDSVSGYQLVFGDSANYVDKVPGLLVAWIFFLLALCASIFAVVLLFLKKDQKVANFSGAGLLFAFAGLLAFVAGILFFCAKPLADANDSSIALGAGAIIPGIAGILAGLAGIAAFVIPVVKK